MAAADARLELDAVHGQLLEALPCAVLLMELDGRISFVNAEAERLFGIPRERLVSADIDELAPEQLRERYRELRQRFVSEAVSEPRVLRGERVMKGADGREVALEIAISQVDLGGRRVLLSSSMDLSDKKRVERQTIEQLHSIFEKADHGIFMIQVTPEGDFLFEAFNPTTERWTGVTSERAHGRRPDEIMPREEAARLVENYRRCVDARAVVTYEESPGEPSGHRVFRTTLIPILNDQGLVHRIIGLAHDVTQQKQIESALLEAQKQSENARRETEQRFSKVFRVSPQPVLITRLADSVVVEVNHAFEQLFGLPRSEAVGRSTFELALWIDPDDRARVTELLGRQGFFRDVEVRGKARDGRILGLLLSGEPIELDHTPCIVTFLRDLTDQQQAEKARAELERRALQAQKLEALGTLAGGIAHDFNNILGAIVAYGELVRLDAEDPVQVKSHAAELQRAGSRAKELIQQILSFGRQQKQERRPIRLEVAIREAVKLLRSTLPSTIQIDVQIAGESPIVLADLIQIHQVLLNLGTNAAHAMAGRIGQLTIRLDGVEVGEELAEQRPGLQLRRYARLSVADNGCGMSPETLKRIYEPFFTTKAPGEGTGLGLAVIHGIVQEHEGLIAVESELGKGTRFELFFPEHSADLADERQPPAEYSRGNGESVLFVDDEVVLCSSVARLLERLGYRVTACSKPREALALLRRDPRAFDVVLTDLTMPQLTGLDLAREVHDLDPHKPVLVMTGFSGSWSSDSLRSVGIYDLVPKPLSAQALASAVAAALAAK
ncbi:MAG: PAS domain S-box protein [Myxococcota bacterium]|nr:PAS domain S-box protein [Myxococcota bacterium]